MHIIEYYITKGKDSIIEGVIIIKKAKFKFFFILFVIGIIFSSFIYVFDKIVMPTVLIVGDSEMKARAVKIINKAIIDECSKQFDYEKIIKIDKDNDGNIVMLKADTMLLNKIACDVAINSQEQLEKMGDIGVDMPIGYISKNNILSYFGPNITVKMQPIGHVETKYSSQFESAGINQTRHKIYLEVKTKVRVIIPLKSNELEIKNELPIAETIIVGKTPNNFMTLDLQDAGFKMNNP